MLRLFCFRGLIRSLLLFTATAVVLMGCNDVPASTPAEESASAESIEATEPIPQDDALPPVQLAIPAIGLETDVTPMGWRITQTADGDTTTWDVPYATAGWHVTSAGAGSDGKVVISGHQIVGEAVFAPLALGEVEAGQQIFLTNENDETFVYEVTNVADPVPLVGATVQDLERAESFAAPSDEAELTLVTGWPDFSTTHYLFVSAEFVGTSQSN